MTGPATRDIRGRRLPGSRRRLWLRRLLWAPAVVLFVVALPVLLIIAVAAGTAEWLWRRPKIMKLRRIKMQRQTENKQHMLDYDVRFDRNPPSRGRWRRWHKHGGPSNYMLVEAFMDSVLSQSDDKPVIGIRVRNATGSGKRNDRHLVGVAGSARVFKRIVDASNARMNSYDSLAHRQASADLRHAINEAVDAVDALIAEYEGGETGATQGASVGTAGIDVGNDAGGADDV